MPTITIIILSLTHGKCHIGCLIVNNYWMSFFVISGIIKVVVSVTSRAEGRG